VDSQSSEHPTIVLLGASNLTRGISTVVETLRLMHGSPLRLVTALGHGRSYGMRSSFLGRSLTSILECGLWNALTQGAPPRFALLTDIGNDVMYEAQPETIGGWIAECVDRLARLGVESINITALPMHSIQRVKPWQYAIVRAVLFPSHHIAFEEALSRAVETQRLLEQLVVESPHAARLRLVQHERDWYGFDPIHIQARHWPSGWSRFLARETAHHAVRAKASFDRWRRLRLHMPADYERLGKPRQCQQPLVLPDGSAIEMY
jgi:hypothetical protein